MTKTFLQAERVGEYVMESLNLVTEGKVAGVTSKGVFFLFGRYSLFLTRSQALSPFNIIIHREDSIPMNLQVGDEVFYSVGDLLIPEREVTIALGGANIWYPPDPKPVRVDPNYPKNRLLNILIQMHNRFAEKGFLFLIDHSREYTDAEKHVKDAAYEFAAAFFSLQEEVCLAAADKLFGLGGGLTPSGDDLITGFILFQARLNGANGIAVDYLCRIGEQLTQRAYQRTTWVSANRLEAACKGWSEEMFLDLIEVITGDVETNDADMIRNLYEFGHSSGVDTTVGIALSAGALP